MNEAVFSVSEINEYVRMLIDSDARLHRVWLRGEISNFTNHYKTGHFYFSLKDESCSIRAVMFRGSNVRLGFLPQNGMRVLVCGQIRAYPRDGQTQIVVDDMQPDGAGSLALAFEQLKRRLEAEGLFDAARKKPLPPLPHRIGVITSATGAAVHDVIRITARRFPLCEILIYPALVQGSGAAQSLTSGVEFFNSVDLVDLIIIGRGGGSMEDLWAFNDEALARTIAASRLPVISAVGHESDVTICDFVSDVRAPTPSGAAEIAGPDQSELYAALESDSVRLNRAVLGHLTRAKEAVSLRQANRFLASPRQIFDERRMHLCLREERLQRSTQRLLALQTTAVGTRAARLEALSPLAILSRGYSMVSDAETGVIRSGAASLHQNDLVLLRFSDGSARARVETVSINKAKERKGKKTLPSEDK